MTVSDSAISLLLRPRVLHALPGRMRVHVPFLKRWGAENAAAVQVMARLLCVPEGIDEAVLCAVTGNVLVHYDAQRLSADEVIEFLRALIRLGVANRDRLAQMHDCNLAGIETRLAAWLKCLVSYRLQLDCTMRIPQDVMD